MLPKPSHISQDEKKNKKIMTPGASIVPLYYSNYLKLILLPCLILKHFYCSLWTFSGIFFTQVLFPGLCNLLYTFLYHRMFDSYLVVGLLEFPVKFLPFHTICTCYVKFIWITTLIRFLFCLNVWENIIKIRL
jgi:hypothetical protein